MTSPAITKDDLVAFGKEIHRSIVDDLGAVIADAMQQISERLGELRADHEELHDDLVRQENILRATVHVTDDHESRIRHLEDRPT
jgi:hypothetical protein